jgi:hypothetical protein
MLITGGFFFFSVGILVAYTTGAKNLLVEWTIAR